LPVRDFLRGAGAVFLVFTDLWCLLWVVLGTIGVLTQGDSELGKLYAPGLAIMVAFAAGLAWVNVRVVRGIASRRRRSTSQP
jgi:hypothetical protein